MKHLDMIAAQCSQRKRRNRIRRAMLFGVAIAAGVLAYASAFADDGPPVVRTNPVNMSGWACGNVQLYYEQLEYPASDTYISRYHVVNPDAINYDRSLGVPRYIVEWRLTRNNPTLTLNGWPCTLISMPKPKVSRRIPVDPEVEMCTGDKKEC